MERAAARGEVRVLDEGEGDVVGRDSVEVELLVRDVLLLLQEDLADHVPEGVGDDRLRVLHLEDLIPLLPHRVLVPRRLKHTLLRFSHKFTFTLDMITLVGSLE